MNMGAYFHVAPRLKTCMLGEGRTPPHQMPYVGRPPCASTATGFGKVSSPPGQPSASALTACVLCGRALLQHQVHRSDAAWGCAKNPLRRY